MSQRHVADCPVARTHCATNRRTPTPSGLPAMNKIGLDTCLMRASTYALHVTSEAALNGNSWMHSMEWPPPYAPPWRVTPVVCGTC
jgi:hypothetical protein